MNSTRTPMLPMPQCPGGHVAGFSVQMSDWVARAMALLKVVIWGDTATQRHFLKMRNNLLV